MSNGHDDQREPAPGDEEGPGDGPRSHRPPQVHLDDVKEAHTTHWDMDVMSRDELEALYAERRRARTRRRLLRVAGVAGGVLAVACAAGWVLLHAA